MRAADAYRARRREEEDCLLVAELEHPLIAQLKLKRSARLDATTWRATQADSAASVVASSAESNAFMALRNDRFAATTSVGGLTIVMRSRSASGARAAAVALEQQQSRAEHGLLPRS